MKVIIAGSTGMVGELILNQCLNSPLIAEVVSLVRNPTGRDHQKLSEIVIQNFEDYSAYSHCFMAKDIAFFCIGVYTGQVKDDLFKKITVDYAVKFATALKEHSPNARICLLSGAGADITEKSKTSFARYKGMAENKIRALDLEFYTFRPAYIYPVVRRKEPNIMYRLSRALYPIIKIFGKNASIRSDDLAAGMFKVGVNGTEKQILENRDILAQV